MEQIAVIVPALNEAGNIGDLVRRTKNVRIPAAAIEVIVVDNGSTDATAEEAERAGACVVRETRQGYGFACAAGAAAAEEKGAGLLVFLDGDFSSLPEELALIAGPVLSGTADLAQGSRRLGRIDAGAMPLQQRAGNRLAAALIRRLYGVEITDLGPYRAIRPQTLARLGMSEMTYGWPTEMTVKAARRGLRIAEPPVTFARRNAGRSKISRSLRGALLAGWYIVGVSLRYAWSDDSEPPT